MRKGLEVVTNLIIMNVCNRDYFLQLLIISVFAKGYREIFKSWAAYKIT